MRFKFTLSYAHIMVVLDDLPVKTGECGCWLPTSIGLPVRKPATTNMEQKVFPMLTNSHAAWLPFFLYIIIQFLDCADD